MYAKIFASLWDGTLRGSRDAQIVFIYLLAHADEGGEVDIVPDKIADDIGLEMPELTEALLRLEAEDGDSRSPDEGGRRIVPMDPDRAWGWRVVNYQKYRDIKNREDRKEQNRLAQERRRQLLSASVSNGQPPSAESAQAEVEAEADTEEEKTESTPSAPRSEDASPVVFELPLRDGSNYPVRQSQVSKWTKAFPDVLIVETLRQQLVWLESNPARRKTRRGIVTFITSWFNREQNTPTKETAYAPRVNGR